VISHAVTPSSISGRPLTPGSDLPSRPTTYASAHSTRTTTTTTASSAGIAGAPRRASTSSGTAGFGAGYTGDRRPTSQGRERPQTASAAGSRSQVVPAAAAAATSVPAPRHTTGLRQQLAGGAGGASAGAGAAGSKTVVDRKPSLVRVFTLHARSHTYEKL